MQLPYAFSQLNTDKIDTGVDPFSLLRTADIDESLVRSIETFGILQPLLVQIRDDKRICLSGFNRLQAAKTLKLPTVPCRVLPEDIGWPQTLSYLYLYKKGGGVTTRVEDGCLLLYASDYLNEQELMSLLALMGYRQSTHVLKGILGFFSLAPEVTIAVHQGMVSEKSAKKLQQLDRDDQQLLSTLITRYKYGGSKQQKLIDLATELTKRLGCSFNELYSRWLGVYTVTDKKNIPQQATQLLDYLQELHSPRSRKAEEDFQLFVRQLRLPEYMKVMHSPAFEQDSLTLQILFPSQDKMEEKIEDIAALLNR